MTQPTALFLADVLEDGGKPADIAEKCAVELRRLHAELERCKQVCAATAEGWRSDAALADPVAPVAPRGMVKLKMAAVEVPLLVMVAEVPGSPVVAVPTVMVAPEPPPPPVLRLPLTRSSEWRASPDRGRGVSFQPLGVRGP